MTLILVYCIDCEVRSTFRTEFNVLKSNWFTDKLFTISDFESIVLYDTYLVPKFIYLQTSS